MKLKLEAISPVEGIGIIRAGRNLRLVRPPYQLHESSVLAEDSLEDAILKYGFSSSHEEFNSWEEAIEFLNRKAVDTRLALGKEIPESISGSDILDVAPVEVLNKFLERIERELIPHQMFDYAQNFLLALLTSNVLTRDPEICRRAAQLLHQNEEAREQAEDNISDLSNRDVRFPSLERHHQMQSSDRLAKIIRARRCILALG